MTKKIYNQLKNWIGGSEKRLPFVTMKGDIPMNLGNDQKIDQNREEFYIDTFRPEDAQGIVRLFRAVYGEHYPIQLFYDPQTIIAVN